MSLPARRYRAAVEGEAHRTETGSAALAMVAIGCVALASFRSIAIVAVACATLALVVSAALRGPKATTDAHVRVLAAGLAFTIVVVRFVATLGSTLHSVTLLLIMPATLLVVVIVRRPAGPQRLTRWVAAVVLMAAVVAVGFTWIERVERPQIDVLELHVAAAEVLGAGGNPYADVEVADTHPDAAPGAVIAGYPYPPLTMLAYASSRGLAGDPRWASVVGVAVAILLLVRPWRRDSPAAASAALAVALVVVVLPDLGPLVRNAWTEPIAMPLIVGSSILWTRRPVVAAALLGLALGTKQYWVLALPLIILWDDEHRWARVITAGSVAAGTILPAFVVDAGATWQSLVTNVISLDPRADSVGLAGIGWSLPLAVVVPVCVAVVVWMRRVRSGERSGPHRFFLALAATLASAFLLGSQAFANYWFLVAVVTASALAHPAPSSIPPALGTRPRP